MYFTNLILSKAMGEGVMSAKRTLENLKIFHEGDKTSFKLLKVTGKEVIFR